SRFENWSKNWVDNFTACIIVLGSSMVWSSLRLPIQQLRQPLHWQRVVPAISANFKLRFCLPLKKRWKLCVRQARSLSVLPKHSAENSPLPKNLPSDSFNGSWLRSPHPQPLSRRARGAKARRDGKYSATDSALH